MLKTFGVLILVFCTISYGTYFDSREALELKELETKVESINSEAAKKTESHNHLLGKETDYRLKNIGWGGVASLCFLGSVALKASIANPPGDVNSKEPVEGEAGLRATSIGFDVGTVASVCMIVRNKIKAKRMNSKAEDQRSEQTTLINNEFKALFNSAIKQAKGSDNVYYQDSVYKILSKPSLLTTELTPHMSDLSRIIEKQVLDTVASMNNNTSWSTFVKYATTFRRILRGEQPFFRKYCSRIEAMNIEFPKKLLYANNNMKLLNDKTLTFQISNNLFTDLKYTNRQMICNFDTLQFERSDKQASFFMSKQFQFTLTSNASGGSVVFNDTDKYYLKDDALIVEVLTISGTTSNKDGKSPTVMSDGWFAKVHIVYSPRYMMNPGQLYVEAIDYKIEYNKNLKLSFQE